MPDAKRKAIEALGQRVRQLAEEARQLENPVLDAILIEAEREILHWIPADKSISRSGAAPPADLGSIRR